MSQGKKKPGRPRGIKGQRRKVGDLGDPAQAPRRAPGPTGPILAPTDRPPDRPEPGYRPTPPVPPLELDQVFGADYVDAHTLHRVRRLAHEMARRRAEALNLFVPLAAQQEFLASRTPYRLARGSNRSGKTLTAAVEVARAVCNRDPHGKWPLDGTFFLVGKDQKHVAKVLYEKLFRPGAFKIVRDERSGAWRAYRPWDEADAGRESEARKAPPLIPERLVREVAWENKKENVPSVVRLTTGWELYFFSSLGKPPQGSPIDGFWLDEEIVDPAWYPELAARVVDRRGRGIWSATPQAGTDQLYELHERAERERVELEPSRRRIEEFVLLLQDNKHIDEQAKRDLAADLTDEDARVRISGEYAITSYKVYPTFNMLLHGWPQQPVPAHWTRYAYIDPGHRVCAVLFAAVPPPEEGDFVLLYDELYLREVNAATFAEGMRRKTDGQVIQAFVMDMHMGAHTEAGTGKTVAQQYSEALAKEGVRCEATGFGFLPASDDVMAGVLAVQGMLRVRATGGPRLRVMHGALPNFEYEIKRYHRKRIKGVVQEQPDQRKDNHAMDDLRYMALHNPRYVRPRPSVRRPSPVVEHVRRKERRRLEAEGGAVVNLGPGRRK